MQATIKELTIVLVAAIILVVLLLLFLYESFSVTIAMLITTLLAVAAVYIGLYHGDGIHHNFPDGHDDDCWHRYRSSDLLLFRIPGLAGAKRTSL